MGLLDHVVIPFFNILKNSHTIFHKHAIVYHEQHTHILLFEHQQQHILFSSVLNGSHSNVGGVNAGMDGDLHVCRTMEEGVQEYLWAHARPGQRLTSGLFIDHSPYYSLRQELSLN